MKAKEQIMKVVFLLAACTSVLAVALICIFLFANGIPAIGEIGVLDFLTGTRWKPGNDVATGSFPLFWEASMRRRGRLSSECPLLSYSNLSGHATARRGFILS